MPAGWALTDCRVDEDVRVEESHILQQVCANGVKGLDGKWRVVFHAHRGECRVYPRTTYIASLIVGGTPDAPKLSVVGVLVKCVVVE